MGGNITRRFGAFINTGGLKMENSQGGQDVAGLLVAFQETGAGFEPLWEVLSPLIKQIATNTLRKHFVFGDKGRGVDPVAVDEVRQQVGLKLCRLALPGQKGRFDPAKAAPGGAGVARWLFGLVSNEVADYCRTWRQGRGKVKITSFSGLELNAIGRAEKEKAALPKGGAVDVSAILNRCIDQLPAELSTPVRLRIAGVTDRDAGKQIGCSPSTVNKRIAKAMKALRPILEAEGIDADVVAALAA